MKINMISWKGSIVFNNSGYDICNTHTVVAPTANGNIKYKNLNKDFNVITQTQIPQPVLLIQR